MGAVLKRVDDPRDTLERARKSELIRFARSKGLSHITEMMPAVLIRNDLRAKGFTRIPIVHRVLGMPENSGQSVVAPPADAAPSNVVNADDDLARQFSAVKPIVAVAVADMTIGQLRKEASRMGLKFTPKNKMVELRQMVQDHGKNTTQ